MPLNRREVLAGMAAVAVGAAQQQNPTQPPQPPGAMQPGPDGPRVARPRGAPKPRTSPAVCLFSQHLIKIEYEALGMVLRDLGFDGCDLAVMPGSHVPPEKAGSDLMRAVEAVSGVGLEVPLLTTALTSGADPAGRMVLSIAGFMGIPVFRPGYWHYGNAPDIEGRQLEVQREMMGLASIARAYNVAMAVHNMSGDNVGASLFEFSSMFRGLDPRWVGYDFDPGYAAESGGVDGANTALRLAIPRLKAVTIKDFYWSKQGGMWKATPCPLGEGMVDWSTFFGTLAKARYTGPITLEMKYQPKDDLSAIRKDLEFVRKQLTAGN
jgi:sugar phosphate isomerase/epimerase